MRLPNGYGSVVKLGGKRRKPFAVRITTGYEKKEDGTFQQKYKYLEYFEKRRDAYAYLSDYNAGIRAKEHVSFSNSPTFAEVYEKWYNFKRSLKRKPTDGTLKNYRTNYNRLSDLHDLKFRNIRLVDLQEEIDKYKDMSSGAVIGMMTVLHGMYDYAIKHEIVEKDYSHLVTAEYAVPENDKHIPFTDEEVNILWEHQHEKDVYVALIMIYTGVRMGEFLTLKTENMHIDKRYMVGGNKTDAGKNRVIPINDKIVPLLETHFNPDNEYFYPRKDGRHYSFSTFYNTNWKNLMDALGMIHKPHDTRHTCATLLEAAGVDEFHRKLILGHAVNDITNGVYTHVATATLIADINKI